MSANLTLRSLPAALLAQHAVLGLNDADGPERPWTHSLLFAPVLGGFGCLPLTEADVATGAKAVNSPGTEEVAMGPEATAQWAALEEDLARNQARQAEQSALIGELEILTTEPAMVTVKPSGDTAEKNDTAGPLSIPSPLHGGSVVKPFLRTPALQQDYSRYWAEQNLNHLAGSDALRILARYIILQAKGTAPPQALENACSEVERVTTDARRLAEQTLARWKTRLQEERVILAGLITEAQRLREAQRSYWLLRAAARPPIGFDGCRSVGEWPE